MRSTLDWIRRHPWIGTSFFLGALLGVIFCLPLIPYKLPDAHASLIGAAFGALVAVWGAAWIIDGKEARNRADSRKFIQREVFLFRTELRQALKDAQAAADVGDGETLQRAYDHLVAIATTYREMPRKVENMRPLFANLGPAGVVAHIEMIEAVNETLAVLQDLSGGLDRYWDLADRFIPPELKFANSLGRM